MSKVILVSGGFDPLHKGHLDLLKEAKKMGDHLSVGLNSDEWLTRKKGSPFMSSFDRRNKNENNTNFKLCQSTQAVYI